MVDIYHKMRKFISKHYILLLNQIVFQYSSSPEKQNRQEDGHGKGGGNRPQLAYPSSEQQPCGYFSSR